MAQHGMAWYGMAWHSMACPREPTYRLLYIQVPASLRRSHPARPPAVAVLMLGFPPKLPLLLLLVRHHVHVTIRDLGYACAYATRVLVGSRRRAPETPSLPVSACCHLLTVGRYAMHTTPIGSHEPHIFHSPWPHSHTLIACFPRPVRGKISDPVVICRHHRAVCRVVWKYASQDRLSPPPVASMMRNMVAMHACMLRPSNRAVTVIHHSFMAVVHHQYPAPLPPGLCHVTPPLPATQEQRIEGCQLLLVRLDQF